MLPPVVLVPGLGCDESIWLHQVEMLDAAGFHVSVSKAQNGGATIAGMVATLLTEQKSESFIAIGFSLGAVIALQAALTQPDRVAALGLLSVNARADAPVMQAMRQKAIDRIDRGEARAVLEENLILAFDPLREVSPEHRQAYFDMLDRAGATRMSIQNRALLRRTDVREHLARISCPTLAMCGEHDAITPLEFASEVAQLIPDAELQAIPNAGHMLTWEQPELVNQKLSKWLRGLRGHFQSTTFSTFQGTFS